MTDGRRDAGPPPTGPAPSAKPALAEAEAAKQVARFRAAVRGVTPRLCPLCGHPGLFVAFGRPPRFDARCPACGSLERHRLFKLWMDRAEPFEPHHAVLHFAPERQLSARIAARSGRYETADLFPSRPVTHQVDITGTGLPAASYDRIVCNHVLEHVDDAAALREMRRLLAPGGLLVLSAPIVEGWARTYENPEVTTPEDRLLHFGQADHHRLYGRDLRDRIRAAGFDLAEVTAEEPDVRIHGLQRGETLFLATRADDAAEASRARTSRRPPPPKEGAATQGAAPAASGWSPGLLPDGLLPDGLPAFAVFRDIVVVPPTAHVTPGNPIGNGGPIWPDWDAQTAVRYCRKGQPADPRPAEPAVAPQRLDGPHIWGGTTRSGFGHLVAEHMTRVLWSVAQRPADPVLFCPDPVNPRNDVEPPFWDVADWFGLPRDRVRLVTSPLIVAELRVLPQAEQMGHGAPSRAYLDLLDANAGRNALDPVPSDLLYVGRAGMPGKGRGGHAGEAHLIDCLRALGASVLDPGAVPLREQLARYAGARRIVFAEGSALHGRQLLGRIDQDILVLNRRKGWRTAAESIRPRVARIDHADVADTVLPVVRDGRTLRYAALAIYDIPALFAAWAGLGLDVAGAWDDDAYHEALSGDVEGWLTALDRPMYDVPATRARVAGALAARGPGAAPTR